MTEQEKINENLQRQIDSQNARIDNVLIKVDMFINESQQQREDMRRLSEKHESEMHEMNKRFYDKFDDLTKQLHTNFVQTMLGVGGMIVALGALILVTVNK